MKKRELRERIGRALEERDRLYVENRAQRKELTEAYHALWNLAKILKSPLKPGGGYDLQLIIAAVSELQQNQGLCKQCSTRQVDKPKLSRVKGPEEG